MPADFNLSLIMRWTALLFFCLCCLAIWAQPPRHFTHFTERDGLSDNRVTCLLRDSQGYLWVGTQRGLNRFDGYTFRQFLPGIPSPENYRGGEVINDLAEDREGRIWIATNKGLARFDRKTSRFSLWTPSGKQDGSLPNPTVMSLALDGHDRLWVSTDNRGIARFDESQDQFISADWRGFVLGRHPELSRDAYLVVYDFFAIDSVTFWLGTNKGNCAYNWVNDKFSPLPETKDLPLAKAPTQCAQDLYMGSWDQDVVRWDPCSQRLERIKLPLDDAYQGGRRRVSVVLPFRNGHVVLAHEGLFWMDQMSPIIQLKEQPEGTSQVPTGSLQAALLDREHNLWIGGDQGLWLATRGAQQVQYTQLAPFGTKDFYNSISAVKPFNQSSTLALDFYRHRLYDLSGASHVNQLDLPPKASFIFEDSKRQLWVGCGSELLLLNAKWTSNPAVEFGSVNAQLSLEPPKAGTVKYDTVGWEFPSTGWAAKPVDLSPIRSRIPTAGTFQAIAEDAQGNLYLGHSDAGLFVHDLSTGEWRALDSAQGCLSKSISSLQHDATRNCLWIGTMDYGLYRYEYATRKFILYQPDANHPATSLGAYMVRGLALDNMGRLWVATDPGGVSLYNDYGTAGQEFANTTVAHGLPSNRCISVVEDAKGRIWVATLSGLACFDGEHGILTFDEDDGLVTEYLDMPLIRLKGFLRDELACGTIYGFQSFDPDSLLRREWDSKVHLSGFEVFGKDRFDSVFSTGAQEIELHWRDNFFSFTFSSASIALARQLEYSCRLQGFENEWQNLGTTPKVSYTNVPPGDYELFVRSGWQGVWEDPGLVLKIHIAPPYWATWWFRILVAAVLLALLMAVWTLRLRQVRRQEALKREFEQKLAHTEMAALRAQMNPHFVFNCLSSINRYILVNQPDQASDYLTKFSRLIRLILDNSRTETVQLSRELEALRLYIELEQMRFGDHFTYTLEMDPDVQAEHLEVPPLLLQPYMENAIWHGLMQKEGPCQLTLRIRQQGKRLHIEIEDNGIGRAKAMELKSRTATAQKSHGMKVTRERIEAINRLYDTQAQVETLDLFDAQGQPAGTRITLTLQIL
jgi:ligand-binding sensor domain-containing protein/HAMP domain-containing protein